MKNKKKIIKTSEYGKGFVYNLVLVAKHWYDMVNIINSNNVNEMRIWAWFNGASDHLYEFEIPKQWRRKKIGRLAKWIKEKGLCWGHGLEVKPTYKDFVEFFDKLEELARLIDKELGIEDIEADWE